MPGLDATRPGLWEDSLAARRAEWSPLREFALWRRLAQEFATEKLHRLLIELPEGTPAAALNDAIVVAIIAGERMQRELRVGRS